MIRGTKHDELIRNPRFDVQIGAMAVTLDKAEVKLVVGYLLHDGGGIVHLQPHPALRVFLQELRYDQGSQVIADGQCRTDIQRSISRPAFEQIFDSIGAVDQVDGMRQHQLTNLIRSDEHKSALQYILRIPYA